MIRKSGQMELTNYLGAKLSISESKETQLVFKIFQKLTPVCNIKFNKSLMNVNWRRRKKLNAGSKTKKTSTKNTLSTPQTKKPLTPLKNSVLLRTAISLSTTI